MIKSLRKADLFSNFNTFSTYLASTITLYFVLSDIINQTSSKEISKNVFILSFFISFSCIIAYGPSYVANKVNISNQPDLYLSKYNIEKIITDNHSSIDYYSDDALEINIEEKDKILSYHDKFVLSCIFIVNVCYVVFPSLFLFNVFTKPEEIKLIKTGIICASAFFGGFCAISPLRNTKNFLIENKG